MRTKASYWLRGVCHMYAFCHMYASSETFFLSTSFNCRTQLQYTASVQKDKSGGRGPRRHLLQSALLRRVNTHCFSDPYKQLGIWALACHAWWFQPMRTLAWESSSFIEFAVRPCLACGACLSSRRKSAGLPPCSQYAFLSAVVRA